MIEIAKAGEETGVFQKDIAVNQDISVKYLDHIIHALKVSGLICNVKGKKSGYKLTRATSEITMLDIHNAFENGICVTECLSENVSCGMEEHCEAKTFWGSLNKVIIDFFKSITLKDMLNNPDSYC